MQSSPLSLSLCGVTDPERMRLTRKHRYAVLSTVMTLRWTLEGADASKFALDGASLNFDEDFSPNFEKPADADKDNVYEVTVVVPVAGSVQPGKGSVKVTVTDAEDTGSLKIAARQPQVGATVSGTLTDEDGGVRDREWQWYRGGEVDYRHSHGS